MVLTLFVDRTETPIGELTIVADREGRLRALGWDLDPERDCGLRLRHAGVEAVAFEPRQNSGGLTAAIDAYFAGSLAAIDSLPVEAGGTPFQRDVWMALRKIPCGTTITYAELARRIGRPSAVRAVGLANGSNPVGVVVPCHRVIGSNGTLTGYGGGIERKRWLLTHEGRSGVLDFDPS